MAGQVSRRKFFGTAAATVGVLGLAKSPELLAQVTTQRFGGNDADYDRMVKLASNENNYGPPKAVMDSMQGAWKYANRYGYPDGDVIEAIAAHHGLKPENVLLTAGSGEVLQVVGTTFLLGGKKVVGADPSYGSVYQHATNIKAEAIKVPLRKDYTRGHRRHDQGRQRQRGAGGLLLPVQPEQPDRRDRAEGRSRRRREGHSEGHADPDRRGVPPLRGRPELRRVGELHQGRPPRDRRAHLLEDRRARRDAHRLRARPGRS